MCNAGSPGGRAKNKKEGGNRGRTYVVFILGIQRQTAMMARSEQAAGQMHATMHVSPSEKQRPQ